jgi:LPPG:FO 2-phospho-L-lactate transferase
VTEALCDRWSPGVRLLPATDDRLETHVVVPDPERAIHFQEWWIRYRAGLPARRFVFVGAESATPAPGTVDALKSADLVLVAPSNPVVSIAPILAIAGLRDALVSGPAPVIGVSPIISGAPVRGMADRCLAAMSVPVTAQGVGTLYGSRAADRAFGGTSGGILNGWLVDPADAGTVVPGVTVRECPLWMTDEQATLAIVRQALALAEEIR